MDETTQQIIALTIVAVVVGLELFRRHRKKRAGKVGCDGCDAGDGSATKDKGETEVRFYKKQ